MTAAIISTLGAVISAVLAFIGAWHARRNDRAAKQTDQALESQREERERAEQAAKLAGQSVATMAEHLQLIDDLKHDVWDLEGWANDVRSEWRNLQRVLRNEGVVTEIHELPTMPTSRLRKHQAESARRARDESLGEST